MPPWQAGRAALEGEWGRITVAERVDMLYAVANEINNRFEDFLAAEWPTPASRAAWPHI
jgi:acyl-CoA reductase-like NAD-dependent aldehyde dehydrogenase